MKTILMLAILLLSGCSWTKAGQCVDAGGVWLNECYGWKGGICSLPFVPFPPKNAPITCMGRHNLGYPRGRFERGWGYHH